MFYKLFVLFTVVPMAELYLLITIGGYIGALNTIIIIFITATIGAWLARREGFLAIEAIRNAFAGGRIPADELLHGLFIVVGAFALLTPGFLTDLLGISMLIRPIRSRYVLLLRRYWRSVQNYS